MPACESGTKKGISIHAPRKAERRFHHRLTSRAVIFQSTLRARRSDKRRGFFKNVRWYFNPRSAQGGATKKYYFSDLSLRISIHAPRKAERPPIKIDGGYIWIFQSTLRARRSDNKQFGYAVVRIIFQSTLRARRSDIVTSGEVKAIPDFNPRSAQGGATDYNFLLTRGRGISIHAPRKAERRFRCAYFIRRT